ncbi:MAG: HAD-IA family hydrolase [Deltaproteobacteria bacterium]|nr:HAD-IA family hydrolase [Deltaproteobacteria bacterium]
MPAAAIEALLLDLDGTVADTHGLIYGCLDQTAREILGVPFPRRVWEEHVGTPLADLFSLVCTEPQASTIETLIQRYRAMQLELEHTIHAFPGVDKALVALRQRGLRLAIVTTKMHDVARRHIDAIGLADCFDAVVGFDDCKRPKPDPEPFLLAAEALGVEPAAAAGVGDSPVDVQGARAAGILSVAAMWGSVSRAAVLAAKPDHVINDPSDLLRLLIH